MYQSYNYASKNIANETSTYSTMSLNDLDNMLSRETEQNKMQGWNKLDKTNKAEKLDIFAEKYGKTNNYAEEKIDELKQFLRDCLDKSKLKNTKDVYYNKDTKEVTTIPSLFVNSTTHNFTLRNVVDTTNKKTVRNVAPKNTSVKEQTRKVGSIPANKNNISHSVAQSDRIDHVILPPLTDEKFDEKELAEK
jgi:hypothetical protein